MQSVSHQEATACHPADERKTKLHATRLSCKAAAGPRPGPHPAYKPKKRQPIFHNL